MNLFHFSCLSHLKNTASRRQPCEARLSKPFKHSPDRTQGCLVFCTQQRIIYIPHVILSVSAVFWHHFPVSRQLWGSSLAGSTRLVWQCEDAAGTLQEPLVLHFHPKCADRDRALDLPEGPSPMSSSNFCCHPFTYFFLSRDKTAKQLLMGIPAITGTKLAQKPLFWVQKCVLVLVIHRVFWGQKSRVLVFFSFLTLK